jgi:hypothetical protein
MFSVLPGNGIVAITYKLILYGQAVKELAAVLIPIAGCEFHLSRKERSRKEWSMIAVLSGVKQRPASLPRRALRLAPERR